MDKKQGKKPPMELTSLEMSLSTDTDRMTSSERSSVFESYKFNGRAYKLKEDKMQQSTINKLLHY